MTNDNNMTQASADYVMHFDLAADPFAPGFSSDYFYAGAGRREVLDQLIHLARFSDQPVLLSGEAGAGKSILVDVVVTQLHTVMDCCRVMADEFASPDAIITTLSENLHLPIGRGASLVEFIAALRSTAIIDNEPEPILVIVEHAQALSVECLNLLLALQKQSDGVVHLFLVGSHQLAEELSVANVTYKELLLEPLSEQELEEYLVGLLQTVGFVDEELLSAQQRSDLYEESQGNIAKIRQLAPDYLSVDENGTASNAFSLPSTHVTVVLLLFAVLVLGYIFLAEEGEYQTLEQSVPEMAERPVIRETLPLDLKQPKLAEQADLPKKDTASAPLAKSSPAIVEPVLPLEKVPPKSVEEPKIKTAAPKQELSQAAASAEVKPVINVEPVKPKVVTAEPAKTVKPVKRVEKEPAKVPPREQRLLSLPASSYMLQLLGARNEANARALVKRYVGRLPISYFESRLSGKPWYVVLTGPYATRSEASAGIGHLPAELKAMKPWLRQTAEIQSDIRKVHK
jgi:DamX protein